MLKNFYKICYEKIIHIGLPPCQYKILGFDLLAAGNIKIIYDVKIMSKTAYIESGAGKITITNLLNCLAAC